MNAWPLDGDFVEPDLTAPVDEDAILALGPPSGSVKGMFFALLQTEVARRGHRIGRDRYVRFRGYPLEEWLRFLPEAARLAHPGVPTREGMRRLGHGAFETFTASTAGKVLFSMAGMQPEAAARLTGRAFDVIGSHGRVEVLESERGRVVLRLSNMWDYIEGWHVGVYEGAAAALGVEGRVRVRMASHCDGDVEMLLSRPG